MNGLTVCRCSNRVLNASFNAWRSYFFGESSVSELQADYVRALPDAPSDFVETFFNCLRESYLQARRIAEHIDHLDNDRGR